MITASAPYREKLTYIAEDDHFIASTIEILLREHGVEVQVAKDGEEVIKLIEERLPHLLLLDLLMPRMDGYQVLAYIRNKQYVFPIIVVTNMSLEADKELSLDVSDIIVKCNLDEEELWNRIKKFLE
jgi:DNA-binding response OmpR family regulator